MSTFPLCKGAYNVGDKNGTTRSRLEIYIRFVVLYRMCITVFRIQTKVTAGTYVTHKSLFANIFLKCVQMFLYICCSVVTPIVTLSIITTTYNKGLDMVDKAGVGEKKMGKPERLNNETNNSHNRRK